MARAQVVPKKGSNPSSAKKGEQADAKPSGGASVRPSRRPSGPSAGEGAGREPRPVSTRAALGFKDDD